MTPTKRRHSAEAVVVALAAAHNWLSNRRIPAPLYVPANLNVAAALVGAARWGGASSADLGLDRRHLKTGLRLGAAAGAVVTAAVVAAASAQPTRGWFADDRALALSPRAAVYETLVRIPLGTALAEELTFRSALLGLSLGRRSWPESLAWTSALFGLWHVLPTIDTLPKHEMGRAAVDAGRSWHAVAAAVVGTGIGGALLGWLRKASGSVAAPVVVHAMLNATALFAARRAADTPPRRRATIPITVQRRTA